MTVVSCLLLCGIKFALCELGRPPIWRIGGNRCVRAYMAGTHVRSKKEKFLHIGVFFRLTVWYTQLNKSEFEEIE